MKAVQMLLEEPLLGRVDAMVKELETTRSEFIRAALERELKYRETQRLEAMYSRSYEAQPAVEDESWNPKRAWGEA